ncbi:MAG: tellurium resistance protein TerC [Geobacteraceae bacterium GWC2_58_44]|nr:MAG: tellurium resistance protein TerC [Geobacteraceae bacterium GWC2_58_44]HBG07442.1 tellurium resistance protein TerC [Geobacter sp.]
MLMWSVFALLLTVMLLVDLGLNRKSHTVSFKEALGWSLVWIGLALSFNAGIWYVMGSGKALEFFTGYVIEKALSVDNLFVFIMIFSYFGIEGRHQTRILKWGILGALVMRGVFIFGGIELLQRFTWLFYLFGAFLVFTAWKMAFGGEGKLDPAGNPLVRLCSRIVPVSKKIHGDWFLIRKRGIWVASPLLLALVMVESSDVVFAIDSIPAIFAVTLDPFIVFTSNIFAIMGLRALYFLLSNMLGMFAYLKYGISFILAFVGMKMLVSAAGIHVPIPLSLAIILGTLLAAVLASLLAGKVAPACSKVSGQ